MQKASQPNDKRKNILIVDDSALERAFLTKLLKSEYEIISAVNGEEALALLELEHERISAIVLDIVMPVMDGYEVMSRLRASSAFSHIPVIVCTSLEDDEAREKAIACGANGFVTKPYNRTLLLHAVQNAVHLHDMTVLAEQAKAELQQKKLLDNLPCGAALFEFDGEKINAVHINKSYWKLVSREARAYSELSIFENIHPDDREIINQELRSAIRQSRDAAAELRILGGDGSYRPFHVSVSITAEGCGRFALYAVFTPISDEAMSMQHMLPIALSAMMSSSDDYSYVMDRDFRYICCSRSAAEVLGLESERDIFGKTDLDLFGSELGSSFIENNRRISERGEPVVNRIEEIPKKNGGVVFVSTSIYPLKDSSGSAIGYYGICHDVTRERRLNFELDTLLNTIPSGVLKYAADEGEQFEYINRNFIESLGYTEESFKAKFHNCFREMIWHEDREWAEAEVIRQEGGGEIGRFDYRVEAADGQLRWIHDEGIKITDSDGKSWYYVALVDITDSHEAYAQLKLVTDSTPGGLATYVCTPESFRVSYCNNDFCALFETTLEHLDAITAADPIDYVFEDDRDMLRGHYERLIRENTTLDCIYRICVKSGRLKWVHQRAVVAARRGETVYINSALFDITTLHEAQERLRVSEELNRIAMEHSGKIVTQFDVASRTLTLPESLTPIFELPHVLENTPEEQIALGRVSPETAEAYRGMFEDIISGGSTGSAIYRQHSVIGWRWLEAHYTTVFSSAGRPISAVITFEDISERLEKEVVYSKWQQSLTDRAGDSYTLFRCNLSKNNSYDSLEGTLLDTSFTDGLLDFDEITTEYVRRFVCKADREKYLAFVNSDAMLAGYYRGRRSSSLEYREIMADGTLRWLLLSVELVEYPNSREVEAYMMYENINDRKLVELQTKEKAETDPLTGVLNRTTFAARMEESIAASDGESCHALMMVDIDDFKNINDSFGHETGDLVLRELTTRIRSILRRDDLVGRLGGDEFFVFLRKIQDESSAAVKAEQICSLNISVGDPAYVVSVSVGVAMLPKDGSDFDTLYRKVDAALYRKKAAGKNGYLFAGDGT